MRPNTLTNTKTKVSFTKIAQTNTPPMAVHSSDARNHYPQIKHHTPPPRRGDNNPTQKTGPGVASGPNSVFGVSPPGKTRRIVVAHPVAATTAHDPFTAHTPPCCGVFFVVLLRKEVIQPHLPVRLPCYDFVPIADPTFDSSPHKG
jgi:hypothetical protein